MLAMSPLNMELFDRVQTEMTYCKIFKHMVEDYVTRADMKMILMSGNLQVQAGPASGIVTSAVYNGSYPQAESIAMKAEKEAIRTGKQKTIESATKLG
jgi:hypothetical protein